ncbi:kelch-like protein 40 [Penaeus japonicus]|uniref:kelch-like protein 40 n=1 Tax=Penaeus japonicus TaxID=27405 RepID=UPI001C711EB0|nr:kelch-like protein 40 [Penaeus japonicus]
MSALSGSSPTPIRPWQDSLHTVGAALNFLLASGTHSDVTLVVGREGKQFKVHRLILSMRSPVFEDLLFVDAANKGNVVPLKDDSPAAMHWLLNHIYSDKREIESIDLALQVLGLSDKYMVASAYDTSMRYLQTIVKRNNVLKIYKYLVHLFSDNESLRSLCRRVFMDNGNAVLLSQSLLDLSPEALSQLLREPLRVTSEAVILKALVSWGSAQLKLKGKPNTPENLRQEIRQFLPEIRFFTMTSDEFVQSVVTTDVLSPEESVFVLKHIAKPDSDTSAAAALNLNPSREDRSSLINKSQMRTCVCEGVSKSWLTDSHYQFHLVPDDNIVLLALKIQLSGGTEEVQLEIRKEESKSLPLCTLNSRGNNISFKNPIHLRESVTYVFTLHTSDTETSLYGAKFAKKEYEEGGFHITIGPGIFVQAVVFI